MLARSIGGRKAKWRTNGGFVARRWVVRFRDRDFGVLGSPDDEPHPAPHITASMDGNCVGRSSPRRRLFGEGGFLKWCFQRRRFAQKNLEARKQSRIVPRGPSQQRITLTLLLRHHFSKGQPGHAHDNTQVTFYFRVCIRSICEPDCRQELPVPVEKFAYEATPNP